MPPETTPINIEERNRLIDENIAILEAQAQQIAAQIEKGKSSSASRFGSALISPSGAASDIGGAVEGFYELGKTALTHPLLKTMPPGVNLAAAPFVQMYDKGAEGKGGIAGGLEEVARGTGRMAAATAAGIPTLGLGTGLGVAAYDSLLDIAGLTGEDGDKAFQMDIPAEEYGAKIREGVTTGLPVNALGSLSKVKSFSRKGKEAYKQQAMEGTGPLTAPLGYPKAITPEEAVIKERITEATPALVETELFQSGGTKLNPKTLKYEKTSPDAPEATLAQIREVTKTAPKELGELIETTVKDVEKLAEDTGRTSTIKYTDLENPELGDLSLGRLAARKFQYEQSSLTKPVAESIDQFLIAMQNDLNYGGEVSLSKAQAVAKDLKNIERAAGDFDVKSEKPLRIGNISVAGSNVKEFGAAIGHFRRALTKVITDKSKQILSGGERNLATEGYHPDRLAMLNDAYGAMKTIEPALDRVLNQGQELQVMRPSGESVASATTKQGFFKKAIDSLRLPAKQTVQWNERVLADIKTNIALSKRTLIKRSVKDLMADPRQMGMLGTVAYQLGMLPINDPADSPSVALAKQGQSYIKDVMKAVASMMPDLFDPAPEGLRSYFDGKIDDPMEASYKTKTVLEEGLSPAEEAQKVGGLLDGGRYAPTAKASSMMPQAVEMSPDIFSQALGNSVATPSLNKSYSDTDRMLEQMNKTRGLVDYERSGL